jgi:hypothetical protein
VPALEADGLRVMDVARAGVTFPSRFMRDNGELRKPPERHRAPKRRCNTKVGERVIGWRRERSSVRWAPPLSLLVRSEC